MGFEPPQMDVDAQCCIVGGGPAELVLGWLLARAGLEVLVLEPHVESMQDSRRDLLAFVRRQAARYPGFQRLQDATVVELVRDGARVTGVIAATPVGRLHVHADLVVPSAGGVGTDLAIIQDAIAAANLLTGAHRDLAVVTDDLADLPPARRGLRARSTSTWPSPL